MRERLLGSTIMVAIAAAATVISVPIVPAQAQAPARRGEHRGAAGPVAARGVIRRPARLAPRPVVRESGLTRGACCWQDYTW
jgi:hypothetical protein